MALRLHRESRHRSSHPAGPGVNLYAGDQSRLPAYVHLGRATGGPLLNLAVAGLLTWIAGGASGWPADLATRAISTNLFFGLGGWLPLPSVDIWVIRREIVRRLRRTHLTP